MQSHYVMLGVFAAATLGAGLVMSGQQIAVPALAQEQPAGPAIDISSFVKIGNTEYDVTFDPSVDLNPISSTTVRKIAYGHETVVNVVTTSTGTYSSDALASPNVLYPGVTLTEREADAGTTGGSGASWDIEVGPALLSSPDLPSFIVLAPVPSGGDAIVTDRFTCVVKSARVVCI